MATYNKLNSLSEFSQFWKEFPISPKNKVLAQYIDYFLWQGGNYLDLKSKIGNKAFELNHRGYRFPGVMFSPKTGNPSERSFLGHIATRAIQDSFILRIGDNTINETICNLSIAAKNQKNKLFENLIDSNPYLRIEGFNGEKRNDSPKMFSIDSEQGSIPYLPTKEDCDTVIKELSINGRLVSEEEILKRLSEYLKKQKKLLKENWEMITKRNLEIWGNPEEH